jgi:ABC-2 type transport system permease protein
MSARAAIAPAAGLRRGAQTAVLTRRMLEELLAAPAPLIGTLILAPGFLLIQNALFGGVAETAPGVDGDYLTFIIPGAVLLTTLASGNAGFAVLRDKEDRYFDRLLTMPVSSVSIAAAPLLFGAAFAVANATLLLTIATCLGHGPTTGFPGALAMLAIAGVWGLAIAGFLVTVAVVTESMELLQLADLACFPLLFLSPLTLPQGEFTGWLQVVCSVNPATYAVQGLRSLMYEGWVASRILPALAVVLLCAGAMLFLAAVATRRSTARA